ncbi:MAG: hypothetical protein KKF62_03970 [Bacteroidetes bacterium]|nr:hypothetical protein [Bacteroidota bacterium]MBU1116829.1 hypothetical protein [Bacteroidota bacterium]MBU1796888.1 hypothetical protein [Bacteroidota bacterium]
MLFKKIPFLLLLFISSAFAQVNEQIEAYRNDPYGNIQYRREGLMDGNLVRTLFYNNGEVGQWPFSPSGEWLKGTGHNYLDGVAVLIASEITTDAGIVHPLETSYREWMDRDPVNGTIWGLEAVPGYANASSEDPAISTNPDSWPDAWPSALPNLDDNWNGYWYGYFGRGVKNADFETFFVMDDSKDGEFAGPPYNFHPVENDHERQGIGLRVETRGFQWSHVLAEDIIFWHYDIVNLSDNDYEKTYFGFYTDTGVGGSGDNSDDNASYNILLDLAYAFDDDGYGAPGRWKTGYLGYAYLESPGNSFDSFDNDDDGMVDESRADGIDNDGDWLAYSDLNGNGKWDADENEPLNNDVGQDGVGPFDSQYIAPDAGEGDGIPTDGEPNFDKTDKDESDQIGLTSLSIYRLGDGGTGGGWPKDDESMWLKMQTANFDTSLQKANISMVFASGAFPLRLNARERFSMALLFGEDLEDLFFNKETVQQIYNANYNFSRPPDKPKLTAVPGDKKVFLYWDNAAEQSRDPFLGFEQGNPTLGYKKDFEGYLVYRSQEPEFNDIKVITDTRGNAKYSRPIAQFDLIDGILGPDPIGINGASFNRGKDTGLQHSFIDTTVTNGKKYYYALVSYDMGDPSFGTKGLVPSECTKIITEDNSGNVKFVDYNCAVIVPNAPAAGYLPPQLSGDITKVAEGIGTGQLNVVVLNEELVVNDASYKVEFTAEGNLPNYITSSYNLIKTSNGATDTLITKSTDFGKNSFTQPFDGLVFSVLNDTAVSVNLNETGWLVGSSNLTMEVNPDATSPAKNVAWPADYEIRFYGDEVVAKTPFFKLDANFLVINTTTGDTSAAEIFDNDGSADLSYGDEIVIIEYAGTLYKLTWRINYHAPGIANVQPKEPVAGDIFQFKTTKQFATGDYFTFNTQSASIDDELVKDKLKKISVVPNPYIAATTWERRNLNQTGRGERKINFINLPAECTVSIYTVSGDLVKELVKEYSPTNGSLEWNLVSEDGMDVASGLYIYHVKAPNVGEYINKFALIK